jgi:hypothetical protein
VGADGGGDWIHHELNLSRPDDNPDAEWEAWRAYEVASRGYPLPTWDMFSRLRPDVVKRWLVEQQRIHDVEGGFWTTLTFLHYYAVVGFEVGAGYTLDIINRAGHALADVTDTLAVAFLNSPSMGMNAMAPALSERLARWDEPAQPFAWPDGWDTDYARLRCGADFSSPRATPEDLAAIRRWYLDVTGEVPRAVEFLAEHHPDVLKALRGRLETALRSMPVQMLPYLLIGLEASRMAPDALRDALLLGRGLGLTKRQAIAAAMPSLFYSSLGGISVLDRVGADLLADW